MTPQKRARRSHHTICALNSIWAGLVQALFPKSSVCGAILWLAVTGIGHWEARTMGADPGELGEVT